MAAEARDRAASTIGVALVAGARIALADVLLVQWTSFVASPAALAVSLAQGLFWWSLACTALGLALWGVLAVRERGAPSRRVRAVCAALAIALPVLAYTAARARMLKVPLGDPRPWAVGVATLVLALPALLVHARGTGVSAARARVLDILGAIAMGSLPLVACATWASGAHGPRTGSGTLAVGLFVAVVALDALAALILSRFRARPLVREPARIALLALFAVVSYRWAPGVPPILDRPPVATAAAPREGRPDVVLVVLDTVAASHLSLYGYGRETSPRLAQFAAAAEVYLRATSAAPWTLPGHASLLTGLVPHSHGAHSAVRRVVTGNSGGPVLELYQRPLAPSATTLAELLAAHGWRTAAVVANHGWFSEHYGLLQGFDYVDNRPMNVLALEPLAAAVTRRLGPYAWQRAYELASASTYPAREIFAHADAWLARTEGVPRFLLINLMDAHGPYVAAHRAAQDPSTPEDLRRAASRKRRDPALRYDLSLRRLDGELGAWLASLAERGLSDSSWIVITSDHGETFDRPGENGHGLNLYESALHVPLVVKRPGSRAGAWIASPASTADLVPTLARALDLELRTPVDGVPLGTRTEAVLAENFFAGLRGAYRKTLTVPAAELDARLPSQWALLDGPSKLIAASDGRVRLFDLTEDPGEAHDLAAERPEAVARLMRDLERRLPADLATRYRTPDEEREAAGALAADADAATRERLGALGYAN